MIITIEETHDYELISRMLSQSPSLVKPPTPEKLSKMRAKFLLARVDGNPAGCICCNKIDFFITNLKYLFVLPEYRRKGIATKLNAKAIEVADRKYKTPILISTTSVDNIPVHLLMRRYGFRVAAIFKSPLSSNHIVMFIKNLREVEANISGIDIEEINLEI